EAVVTNNTFINTHTNTVGGGLILHGGGTLNFDVSNNTIGDNSAAHRVHGRIINISHSATSGTFNGRLNNNTIGTSGAVDSGSQDGPGIFVDAGGSGAGSGGVNATISNNHIHGYGDIGI